MALPKIELPHGRFTLRGILREIEEKLGELFKPLDLSAKSERAGHMGAPGPVEWEEEGPGEKRERAGPELAVKTKKKLPGKGPMLDSKKMHKPKRDAGKGDGRGARGKLQKSL